MKRLLFYLLVFIGSKLNAQTIIDVYCYEDSCFHEVIDPEMLFVERWDTLAQSKFWKTVINTTKDTCLINIASNRKILNYIERSVIKTSRKFF